MATAAPHGAAVFNSGPARVCQTLVSHGPVAGLKTAILGPDLFLIHREIGRDSISPPQTNAQAIEQWSEEAAEI